MAKQGNSRGRGANAYGLNYTFINVLDAIRDNN
jgi:hypothetical protein